MTAAGQGRVVTPDDLVEALLADQGAARRLVGIAGPPGSGKSTFTEGLQEKIAARAPAISEVLPMDGFHFDDMLLEARGDRPRKGAPHTFDTGGLIATLRRIMADDGSEIAVPVFDRSIEIARAGARIIGPDVRLILVEGNYLLLDDPAWAPIRECFDVTVFLDVPEAELEARLTQRWIGFGLGGEAFAAKMDGNDMPNVRQVLRGSVPADYRIANF